MTPHPLITDPPAAETTTVFVLPLTSALDEAQCGGKAARLARLTRLGFAVPEAFVITTAALDELLELNGIRAHVLSLTRDLAADDIEPVGDAIRALILGMTIPGELRASLRQAASALGHGPLIARSSGCGEDGAGASFAGQFDSVGDLHSTDDLLAAIVQVWASRWSRRVLAYAHATGAALAGMGVVVQRQIVAAWSGVLFTASPEREDEMLLEFCAGSGEALVSGRVDPGRITISRADLHWALVALPETTGQWPRLDSLVAERPLAALGRTALAIEQAFGGPQDIEWAMDADGRVWVVQARPITATRAHQRTPAAPAPDDGPAVVWSNANVNENFPEPISPLLYSIARDGYYHYFRNLGRAFGLSRRRLEAMEQPLREIIGVHQARMYYNLTSIHAVLRSAPGGRLLAASFDQFVGAEATDTAPAVPFAARVTTWFEVARIAVQTAWQYVFLRRRVARFERRVDAFAADTDPARLGSRTRGELLHAFRAFLDIRRHRWNDAALADAGSMVCYGLLQRALARAYPEAERQSLHHALLKGLPDLVSGKPAIALWALATEIRGSADLTRLFETHADAAVLDAVTTDPRVAGFARSLATFQETWGFRCSGELMLTVPSFQEDAVPLIGLLRSYVASTGESPAAILERQATARIVETARLRVDLRTRPVMPGVPGRLQAAAVMRLLAWTQTCVCLRERARLKQALLYTRLRRVALAIGTRLAEDGRLSQADDIFFLASDEIDALLAGTAMFPDRVAPLIRLRREAHATLARVTPPDRLTLPRGGYYQAPDLQVGTTEGPVHTPDLKVGPTSPGARGRRQLTGLGACGGITAGRATVLADVREAARLRRGDILVTRQTDPGWGPIFPLISGLVIERGGMLSHGAIIAREFGIPAVIGVRDATHRIADGQQVVVDGDRGRVTVEDAPS